MTVVAAVVAIVAAVVTSIVAIVTTIIAPILTPISTIIVPVLAHIASVFTSILTVVAAIVTSLLSVVATVFAALLANLARVRLLLLSRLALCVVSRPGRSGRRNAANLLPRSTARILVALDLLLALPALIATVAIPMPFLREHLRGRQQQERPEGDRGHSVHGNPPCADDCRLLGASMHVEF
ncbi:MAG: hypothetical protein R3F15_02580 [Lysobacterales bacterium]